MYNKAAAHILGEGSVREVANIVKHRAAQRILFVVDPGAYSACGASSFLEGVLSSRVVTRFDRFELNPKLADVERGVEVARHFAPDIVVALGGGTAIDLAKLIGVFAKQDASAADAITGRAPITRNGPPLIAIPTTAGSGSEATHFAVVYLEGQKHSVAHPALQPDHAIIDPDLTRSLPARTTATSGLDAFCQAIESIWAVASTDESVAYAVEAAKLALRYLPVAVNRPTVEARAGMSKASHLAGRAINIGKTTAPHALSYYLTARHNVPHGMAVAVMLSPMLRYNANITDADCADPRGALHVKRRIQTILDLLDSQTVDAACERISQLVREIGCPSSLVDAGVRDVVELQNLINGVNTERLSNNPRTATPEQLTQLFRKVDSRFRVSIPHFQKVGKTEGTAKNGQRQ